jgi:diguanylate cyclase (GGDEF)-like protein/PAS domain S-box-containing protein
MNGLWEQLIGNFAFVGLAISIWAHVSIWFQRQLVGYERIALGLIAGGTAVGAIILAVPYSPGVYLDLRYAPVVLAGLFGGPPAAVIAIVIAIIFRTLVGGAGAVDGAIVMASVGAIGVLVNHLTRKRPPKFSDVGITAAAFGVVLAVFIEALPILHHVPGLALMGVPIGLMNCLTTVICGFIILKTRQVELDRSTLVTAFSQSPDFLYVKDRDSRFIIVNENMSRLYQFSTPEEMIGLTDFNLQTPPVAEELYYYEQRLMRTGEPLIDSHEQLKGRHLLASKSPLRDKEGHVIGLAGVTRDITERIELERALRESKNLLSHAMAGMSDGFAMFDRKGFLIFCNEQYRNAFPDSADVRVVGANIRDILRRIAEKRERTDAPTEKMEEWVETAAATLHRNKDEEVQLSNGNWLSIRTRLAEDGTAMVVVSDITAMKQAEAALKQSAAQLKSLAETDGLTGIVNRRAFDEAFARETARSARSNAPLSLLMIDIDWFKPYNDTYGHLSGDECLKRVSNCLLRAAKRATDVVARYGGEEFVILLPDTDEKNAAVVAEQFAGFLQAENVVHCASPLGRVTASVGISCGRGRSLGTRPHQLLSTADAALYDAKRQGRNRTLFRPLDETPAQKSA